MNTRRSEGLVALLLLLLASCATPTPYQPVGSGRYGFEDQRIEAGKFRVVFRGNSSTPRATVENFVLYRAAQLTLEEGGDHFVVLTDSVDSVSSFRSTGSAVGAGVPFGRQGFFYGPGYGGSFVTTTATVREAKSYTVGVLIAIGQGPKPQRPEAFDARSVAESLANVVAPGLER